MRRDGPHTLLDEALVMAPGSSDGGISDLDEAMQRLTNTLAAQFAESAKLEKRIAKNLASLGFTPEKVS